MLAPVLCLIDLMWRKSRLSDRFIPLALGAISTLLCALWVLSTSPIGSTRELFSAIFTSVTQGILLAGTSMYADCLLQQSNPK